MITRYYVVLPICHTLYGRGKDAKSAERDARTWFRENITKTVMRGTKLDMKEITYKQYVDTMTGKI